MPVSLDHVHLFCSDLAATERFLVEMLGAEHVWDAEAAGARNVRLRLGGAFVHLYHQPRGGSGAGRSITSGCTRTTSTG